jgi:hypothetical protein
MDDKKVWKRDMSDGTVEAVRKSENNYVPRKCSSNENSDNFNSY